MNTHDEQTDTTCKNSNLTVEENSMDHVIETLYEQGLTIMESIKVLISDYGMSLREAKEVVSIHQVWTEVVKATGPLHNTLIEIWKSPEKEHFD